METNGPAVELIKLWPSIFLEQDLPGHEAPTRRLIDLAAQRGDEGVFAIDDPAVQWLKSQVAHGVGMYLRRSGQIQAPNWGARGHFESYEPAGYRTLANQPGAFLAGMYVLTWPSSQDAGGRRDDALPGFVSFYDPRAGMNMNAIKRDPYHGYHHSLKPRPGLLLMWPAHVGRFVHPNWSVEAALAVSFGVQLHGTGEGR